MDNVPVTPDIVASKAAANPTSDETLNKSVTRTINLYKPGTDAPEVKKDTIDFSRTLNDDGSYSDWTVKDGETAVFPKYDVPKIDGYTAYDKDGGNAVWEGEISPIHITGNMSNFNINVAYRADTIYRQLKVVDQNNQVINTQSLQGVKGKVVNVDDDIIPVGYSLVDPSQTIPKSYTMDPNMNVPDIKVKENIIDVDGSHPHKYLDPIEGTNNLLHYPIGLEKEDLDRTIKRIITIKDSDGTVLKTIPQELHVKRTAHVHAYSGEVDYDSWTWDNNKSSFDAVNLGIKDGQTAFINGVVGAQVSAMKANPDLVDVAVDVKVVNDDEVVKVVYYLDGDATKTPLTEGSYLGKFSKDVDLNSVATKENLGLDTGYIVASGALSKYTFTNDKNQVVYVPVTEAVVDVLHDQAAKPGEQIPNYDDDSYPDGVDDNDLNQTITRTIVVTPPAGHGEAKTITQTANISRDAKVHVVSGQVDYGNWSTDAKNWADFKPAAIDGFTVSQSDVPAVEVNDGQKNQTINITYTANDQTMNVIFQDGNGNEVARKTVSGKTDETKATNAQLPTGWVLSQGQSVPESVTFTGAHTNDVIVKIQHGLKTYTSDKPVAPDEKTLTGNAIDGGHASDLNQTITRTITITKPHEQAKTITQTAKITRGATVDEVTGEVTYDPWTTDAKSWTDVKPDSVDGYTVNITDVPAVEVRDGQKNKTVDITYTANDQSMKIIYQDADGATVDSTTVTGKTDQTVDTNSVVPAGWVLTDGESTPATITFKGAHTDDVILKVVHGSRDVTPDKPVKSDEKTPSGRVINGAHESDLNKTITRTVTVTKPGQEEVTIASQPVHLTRTAKVDTVTGEVTYGDWLTGSWDAVAVPVVAGYTPNISSIDVTPVTYETQDSNLHITYTAKDRSIKVTFVDDDAGGDIVGTPTTITGHTGGDPVALDLTVPDKYQLADGQQLPTSYTFTKGSGDVTIHLKHQVVQREATTNVYMFEIPTIKISQQSLEWILPKDQWNLVGEDEYGRPENINALRKKLGTISGHVNYDLVTNRVTSVVDDWTSLNLQDQTFSVPTTDAVVNGVMTGDNGITGKTISEYMKEKQWEGFFADDLKYPLKAYLSQQLTATEGGPAFYRVIVPELVPGGSNRFANERGDTTGSAFKLTEPINRSYLEKYQRSFDWKNGDSSDFRDQNGQLVSDSLLRVSYIYVPYIEKTVTRTINVVKPDGTKQQVVQTATLDKAVSLSTLDKLNWSTSEWASYEVPTIPGYTASQSNVAKETVTDTTEDQTVNITYTANDQQMTITFYDQDGKKVTDKVIKGTTGSTIPVGDLIPDGWELYDGQNVPKDITFKAHNDNQDFVIKHVLSLVSADNIPAAGSVIKGTKAKTYPEGLTMDMLTKTITRIIRVMKDGHQVGIKTQRVTFLRNAVVDAVTGSVKTLAWSEDGSHVFTAYQPASIEGYTVDGAKAMTVSPLNETSTTVIVNYKAVPQALNVIYQTADGQQVGSTVSMVADKDGQIDLTSQLPSGYELATPVQRTNVSDLHVNNYYVTVKPRLKVYTSEDTDIPSGVHLTKAVNRTINITLPNGKRKTIHQTVNFNRMVTIDANGNSTYTDWKAVGTDTFDGVRLPVRRGYKLVFDDGSNGIKAQQVTNAETANDVVINVSYVKAQKLQIIVQKDVSVV